MIAEQVTLILCQILHQVSRFEAEAYLSWPRLFPERRHLTDGSVPELCSRRAFYETSRMVLAKVHICTTHDCGSFFKL